MTATAAIALAHLEPWLVRHETRQDTWDTVDAKGIRQRVTGPREYTLKVETLAEAQGVLFLCPACYAKNGGATGTHSVLCWFKDRGVPADVTPGPGRWAFTGTGLGDLTLVPSVLLPGDGCGWHGHVIRGKVTTC